MSTTYKEWGLTINFSKTKFIAINTDQRFYINIEENVKIKHVRILNIVGVILNIKGKKN